MSLDKSKLFEFLKEVDKELNFEITLVAVGGTALTLLNIKTSTIDIDFTVPDHFEEFRSILLTIPHGLAVQIYQNDMIFSQVLPDDYIEKSIPIKKPHFKRIDLRCLHPIDIVITKIGRLNERDKQDIELCVKNFDLKENDIIKRANLIERADSEENYQANLQFVLGRLF